MVKFNIGKLREDLNRNRKERLAFVTIHARWVKRTPNKIWSRQQKRMLDSVVISADKISMERLGRK